MKKSLLSPHDTPQVTPQVTGCVERLISAVQRETSRAELQAALKLRDQRSFSDTYLKPALETGLIEMTMHRRELQEVLGIAHRPYFLAAYLNPALEAGLIEMTLPDKPTSRNQRYRRTSAGEALARQLTESSK